MEKQLWWHMVHWLCLSDSTYTELTGALPSQLAEQQEALDKVYNCSHVQIHTVQGQLHVLNKHDNKAVWYLSSCDSCLCLRRTRVKPGHTTCALIGVSCHNRIVGHYHYRHAFTLWSECLVRLSCVLCHHIISIGMACRCWQR